MSKYIDAEWLLQNINTAFWSQIGKTINSAPTIDIDRPQGEWVTEYDGNGWNDYWDYTCSNCGKRYERADAVLYEANFCPNCGAKMKGADDDI